MKELIEKILEVKKLNDEILSEISNISRFDISDCYIARLKNKSIEDINTIDNFNFIVKDYTVYTLSLHKLRDLEYNGIQFETISKNGEKIPRLIELKEFKKVENVFITLPFGDKVKLIDLKFKMCDKIHSIVCMYWVNNVYLRIMNFESDIKKIISFSFDDVNQDFILLSDKRKIKTNEFYDFVKKNLNIELFH